jgi:catalase-peroxidase
VAGRLRPLRTALHPHGLAQRRHLPHGRRPRRRGLRLPALGALNSWPDNVNLDKARRLLWPIKQKYGRKISWADLMILAGNCALESMGFKTFGFGGGREDVWEPEEDIYWGSEGEWLGDKRYSGDRGSRESARRRADGPDLREPGRAERQPGSGRLRPRRPRDLRAHGHERRGDRRARRRRAHLRQVPRRRGCGACGPRARGRPIEEQGLGWKSSFGSGKGGDTISSGIEGAWKPNPTKWDMGYLKVLFKYEWELVKSPAGAHQWLAKDVAEEDMVVDAHDPSKKHRPMMTTADLSLRFDPIYEPIARRFLENPEEFADAFARAWFKLTHRDMGPRSRYLGPEVPAEGADLAGPRPAVDHELIDAQDIAALKAKILASGLSVSELVSTAWASASTFRGSDKRGGANGARIRLAPQKDWEVNQPRSWRRCCRRSRASRRSSTRAVRRQEGLAGRPDRAGRLRGRRAGGEERRARRDGPFTPGRTDASQEQTDVESFAVLEPVADGFRNYLKAKYSVPAEELLVDRAQLLTLTAPEMTVLVGGMRVLWAPTSGSPSTASSPSGPER